MSELPRLAKIEAAERQAAENADTVSRLHHSLAKHGWHPGRTDDQLSDLVELALAIAPAGPYANKRGFVGAEKPNVKLKKNCRNSFTVV